MAPATTPAVEPPFVGRDIELRLCRDTLAAALDGRPRLLLLTGEAGIGKSRIAAEIVSGLAPEPVLWGRCHEVEGAPAYWPWFQALRTHIRRCPDDVLRAQVGAGAADLGLLLPELRGRLGDVAEVRELPPEQARFLLFDAVTALLRRASEAEPLVVVLEDLHWDVGESLLLLRHVATDLRDARVLLVGTARLEEPGQPAAVSSLLAELARIGEHVPLSGLPLAEVASFVRVASGEEVSDSLVGSISAATDGNPFFVGEIVQLLRAEGRLGGEAAFSSERFRMPDSVRDAIQRRLDPLPAEARNLLAAAAVLGREFELSLLGAVVDRSGDDVLRALEPALATRLLRELPERPWSLRFSHALVHATLIADLRADARARLHLKAGEAAERIYAADLDSHLGELAAHFLEASAVGGLEKAVEYSTRAGRRALERLGFEEAAGHFKRALEAARALGGDASRRLDLLSGFAEAQRRAGDEEGAAASFHEAARIARELGDGMGFAHAALGVASSRAETGGEDPGLTSLLQEALSRIDDGDSKERVWLMGALARSLYFGTEPARPDALTKEAVTIARRMGSPRAIAAALVERHLALWRPGRVQERLALVDEAIESACAADQHEIECEARAWKLHALLENGDLVAADRELASYVQAAEAVGMPRGLWHTTVVRAARALYEGGIDEAEELTNRAVRLRQPGGRNNASQFHAVQMFHIRRAQGRLRELEEGVVELASRHATLPIWRCGLALLETELGRLDKAALILEEFVTDRFAGLPFDGNWLPALSTLAEVSLAVGNAEAGRIIHSLLSPYFGLTIVMGTAVVIAGPVDFFAGIAALASGQHDEAVTRLECALESTTRAGAGIESIRARLALARALDARGAPGDTDRAASFTREAEESARRLGYVSSLLPSSRAPVTSAPAAPGLRGLLRREGEYWTIGCRGEVTRLKHTKGVVYLALLLRSPGHEIHSLELGSGESVRGGDAGEVLDPQALAAYRRRLKELEEEIAAAKEDGASGSDLEEEHASLEREVRRATGMGGRARKSASDAERARVNVTRAIGTVVRKVATDCPAFGVHLSRAVRTGVFCSYEPDPSFPIVWEVDAGD